MNKYPSKTIEVDINDKKFTLREFTIGFRLNNIKEEVTLNDVVDGLVDAGLSREMVNALTQTQAVAIYDSLMVLTYGEPDGDIRDIDIEEVKKN